MIAAVNQDCLPKPLRKPAAVPSWYLIAAPIALAITWLATVGIHAYHHRPHPERPDARTRYSIAQPAPH